jgi:hypothetical protein
VCEGGFAPTLRVLSAIEQSGHNIASETALKSSTAAIGTRSALVASASQVLSRSRALDAGCRDETLHR